MRDTDQHTEDQYHAHMALLRCIIGDWRDGKITLADKRLRIASENKRYYGGPVKSRGSDELITAVPRASDRNDW